MIYVTHLVLPGAAIVGTYVGTHALCDRVAVRLRRARHYRLTRKHGRMLARARQAGEVL